MRRWGQGKGPLTKEQIDCLDKAVYDEITKLYFKEPIDEDWYEQKKMEKRV